MTAPSFSGVVVAGVDIPATAAEMSLTHGVAHDARLIADVARNVAFMRAVGRAHVLVSLDDLEAIIAAATSAQLPRSGGGA